MIDYILPIFAVVVGCLATLWFLKSDTTNFKLILTFSGAFLLSTTVFELLPDIYTFHSPKIAGIFILFGIIFQIILEFFSKGAEHGHLHTNKENTDRFPVFLFLSLFVHAFLEGFPIGHHETIIYGVFVHKIPIAALMSTYLLQVGFSKKQMFMSLIVFGLMTPFGTLVSNSVEIQQSTLYLVNAVVAGMFFHISTIILFEADKGHQFNLNKLLMIVLAISVAYFM